MSSNMIMLVLSVESLKKSLTSLAIVNRSRNGYETVGNVKVVSIDTFKQLEVVNKVDYFVN